MALANYANLQTDIGVWLAREGDATLATYAPDFITLFECAAARRLKVRLQTVNTTLTPTLGVATIPSDYLGYQRVTWTGQPRTDLDYVSPTILQTDWPTQPSGVPSVFTIEGSSLRVMPLDSTPLEFVYFQRTAAVSAGLNWLFTNHPDAYLFGALCEATMFNRALDQGGAWKARRDEVFQEIAMLDFNERQGMSMRIVGPTP